VVSDPALRRASYDGLVRPGRSFLGRIRSVSCCAAEPSLRLPSPPVTAADRGAAHLRGSPEAMPGEGRSQGRDASRGTLEPFSAQSAPRARLGDAMDHTVQYVRGRTHIRRDVFWFVSGALFMAAVWLVWSIVNSGHSSLSSGTVAATAKAEPATVDGSPAQETTGPMGSLVVNTDPWSRVTIDGRNYGQTPLPGVPLKPGPHVLVCTPESGRVHRETVVIRPGQRVKRLINLAGGE
jgi:hypothetical protein